MNYLSPELISHIGSFLPETQWVTCLQTAKCFAWIGGSSHKHEIDYDNQNLDIARMVKYVLRLKPLLRVLHIHVQGSVDRIPTSLSAVVVPAHVRLKVKLIHCYEEVVNAFMEQLPITTEYHVSHSILNGFFVPTYPERVNNLTLLMKNYTTYWLHESYVHRMHALDIQCGNSAPFVLDLSKIDMSHNKRLRVCFIEGGRVEGVIDPHKVTTLYYAKLHYETLDMFRECCVRDPQPMRMREVFLEHLSDKTTSTESIKAFAQIPPKTTTWYISTEGKIQTILSYIDALRKEGCTHIQYYCSSDTAFLNAVMLNMLFPTSYKFGISLIEWYATDRTPFSPFQTPTDVYEHMNNQQRDEWYLVMKYHDTTHKDSM